MSENTFNIIFIAVMVILTILVFLPYERLHISGTYIKIIRIIVGAVAIGMGAAYYLLERL